MTTADSGGPRPTNLTLTERLTKTPEGERLLRQEQAIQAVTDLMCEVAIEQGVARPELAKRLGCSVAYLDRLLDGRTNLDVRLLADVFGALGCELHFTILGR